MRQEKQNNCLQEGANNSFKQLADKWEKVNNWYRDIIRKAYISCIDKFSKVTGDLIKLSSRRNRLISILPPGT